MKHCLIVILLLFSAFSLQAQQDKRVYITLDVSGSMTGNKYALANYTTQMIVTLCDDDDEVYLIVNGIAERLSDKQSPLSIIQKPMDKLVFGTPTSWASQFDDIIGFNKVYKESNTKQNWLFIIGDGEWGTMSNEYKADRERFSEIIKKGTLNVCYLQTGHLMSYNSDFTDFISTFGVVDIGKSDINPQTIKKGCDHFARKILGFSEVPLKVSKSGQNCISINADMPLKGFYLVYQDVVKPAQLAKIDNITANDRQLEAKLKGSPTTLPLKYQRDEVDLSGHVYWIGSSNNIPANTEIQVCFDKAINASNVSVYPVVENVGFGSIIFNRTGGKLKQLDSQSYSICKEESKARVRIELNGESTKNLPEALLKKTKVVVKANNREYATKLVNGGFECDIDLLGDETQYYAECDCPGYFKRVTPISTIVKGDCEPEKPVEMPVKEMPEANLGTITFDQLKNETITFSIRDSATNETLNPELFDISFEIENSFLYEKPKMHIENDTLIVLELRPKGDWCECLFPESLDIKMISTPKEGAFEEYGKNYHKTVFPLHVDIIKQRSWLSRCLWVIITMIALLLLFFYLRALQRKRRFKKNALIKPVYYDYYDNQIEAGNSYLRKDGFGAWFARWFLPGNERNTLSFDKPTTSLRFVASDSYDVVNIPKEGNIDPTTIRISGYDPKRDQQPKEPVKLGNQGKIHVKKDDGNDDGYLIFNSGNANDGTIYRVVIGILTAATVIAFLFLLYLFIRSFF